MLLFLLFFGIFIVLLLSLLLVVFLLRLLLLLFLLLVAIPGLGVLGLKFCTAILLVIKLSIVIKIIIAIIMIDTQTGESFISANKYNTTQRE